ncbi:MAG: hypothetical protein R2911_23435 [Caldilineaceae bacterium]
MLAQGDVPGAIVVLEEAEEFVQRQNFAFRMPNVAEAQVLTLLRQGDLAAAATLAQKYELPLSQAPGIPGAGRRFSSIGGVGAVAPADGRKGLAR